MKFVDRFIKGDMHGIHYAASIFVATGVLWILVRDVAHTDPIWAVSSMVATSDPLMKQAVLGFRARIINTLVGCVIGILFIIIGGSKLITLPIAMINYLEYRTDPTIMAVATIQVLIIAVALIISDHYVRLGRTF